MDQKKSAYPVTSHPLPPAQLWIGRHEELEKKTIRYLQTHFCSKHPACSVCSSCRLIKNKAYHAIEWIYPEKTYTLDQIRVIHDRISFQLAEHDHLFFILQKADYLTSACANSLLKSLEEPPAGYHFILLAECKDAVLPTIQSRCQIQTVAHSGMASGETSLFAFFSTTTQSNPDGFLKELEASQLHERQSLELLNQLLIHWKKQLKAAIVAHNSAQEEQSMGILQLLTTTLNKPPMPGSAKLFWKNLFLKMHTIVTISKE